ncbi:hypothetical protein BU15DRAFT_51329, partial [Melanogaster broomeanus]
KIPICSRCQTIMYPGPEKSITNHRRGVCADGVRSKPKPKSESEELPPWLQPQGIFSGGKMFHSQAFLKTVKQIYERVFH